MKFSSSKYFVRLDHPNDDNLRALMIEMETMKRIGKHENIISLLKCCTQEGELFVIMEYAGNGSLKDFFKKCLDGNEFNPSGDLIDEMVSLRFSLQIAKGMEYLASRKVSISMKVKFDLINF